MLYPALRLVPLILVTGLLACAHIDDVRANALQPRYVRPTPTQRSSQPLIVVYDRDQLKDVVKLSVASGFPDSYLFDSRALATKHLRAGLESLFERVSVTDNAQSAPGGSLLCTVNFVDVGLAVAPGGRTLVGILEWSVTITRQGAPQVLYSWGERTVGTREGAGAWGSFDPAPVVQGAVEASLRTMLKDMNDKGVASLTAL
jgi:hypothetical protein